MMHAYAMNREHAYRIGRLARTWQNVAYEEARRIVPEDLLKAFEDGYHDSWEMS